MGSDPLDAIDLRFPPRVECVPVNIKQGLVSIFFPFPSVPHRLYQPFRAAWLVAQAVRAAWMIEDDRWNVGNNVCFFVDREAPLDKVIYKKKISSRYALSLSLKLHSNCRSIKQILPCEYINKITILPLTPCKIGKGLLLPATNDLASYRC